MMICLFLLSDLLYADCNVVTTTEMMLSVSDCC